MADEQEQRGRDEGTQGSGIDVAATAKAAAIGAAAGAAAGAAIEAGRELLEQRGEGGDEEEPAGQDEERNEE